MGVTKWLDGIRKFFLRRGYTCDNCGAELFDYPVHRLCTACEKVLLRPRFPCPLCGRERIADGLCLECKESPPKYKRGISPFIYRSESALLVNRMKNGKIRLAAYLGEEMARALVAACGEVKGEPLLLLPVPATKKKTRERGYNPTERLAESVLEELQALGVSVEADLTVLAKKRETYKQKEGSVQERAKNVQDAYFVARRAACKGRRALLVDDIMTSGSTGNEIAKKLLKAGAREVYFLTAAATKERR